MFHIATQALYLPPRSRPKREGGEVESTVDCPCDADRTPYLEHFETRDLPTEKGPIERIQWALPRFAGLGKAMIRFYR
jgi:hypothetical protein